MIISEHFHCTAVCKGNDCDFIENDTLFSIYHKFSTTEQKNSIEKMKEYYILFTSRSGTLNDFVRDIYLHKEQMLQVIDDELTVIYKYDGQCNLSFDPDLLRYLSEMNMHLLVSCYTLDEENQLYTELLYFSIKKGTDSFYYVSDKEILTHNKCDVRWLSKQLDIDEELYHRRYKSKIIDVFSEQLAKRRIGNPDVNIEKGNVVLTDPRNSRNSIQTGMSIGELKRRIGLQYDGKHIIMKMRTI